MGRDGQNLTVAGWLHLGHHAVLYCFKAAELRTDGRGLREGLGPSCVLPGHLPSTHAPLLHTPGREGTQVVQAISSQRELPATSHYRVVGPTVTLLVPGTNVRGPLVGTQGPLVKCCRPRMGWV